MFNTCNFLPTSTPKERISKFKQDLVSNGHTGADLKKRASQRSNNWELLRAEKLSQDLANASISIPDFNEMVLRKKPLGFQDCGQFNQFCRDLSDNIRQAFDKHRFSNTDAFDLVFSGTATGFFTENPTKPAGRHFDSVESGSSDIDIAIVVRDQNLLRQILGEFKERSYPKNKYLRMQQYSQVDSRNLLSLDAFNRKWGEGGYQHLTDPEKASTILRREVGIVLFKSSESPMMNNIANQSIVWSAAQQRNLTIRNDCGAGMMTSTGPAAAA